MRYVSSSSVVIGMSMATFFWLFCFFVISFESEILKNPDFPASLVVKENPVTQNRRYYDGAARTTVLWTPGNPSIFVAEIQKISENRWIVTLEKPAE